MAHAGGGEAIAGVVISLAQPIYLLVLTEKMLETMREEGWRIR